MLVGQSDERYNGVFEDAAAACKSEVVYAQQQFECLTQCPAGELQHFELKRLRDGYVYDIDIDLTGGYQRHNVVTATAAADYLHEKTPLTISRRAYLEGIRSAAASTSLRGRWQKLSDSPLTVCDTGHNGHGMAYVAEQLQAARYDKLYCVVGMVQDKDLTQILPLLPKDAHYIFTQASIARAMDAAALAEEAARHGLSGEVVPGVVAATARARELARPNDMIFIGGSTFVVAEALP